MVSSDYLTFPVPISIDSICKNYLAVQIWSLLSDSEICFINFSYIIQQLTF